MQGRMLTRIINLELAQKRKAEALKKAPAEWEVAAAWQRLAAGYRRTIRAVLEELIHCAVEGYPVKFDEEMGSLFGQPDLWVASLIRQDELLLDRFGSEGSEEQERIDEDIYVRWCLSEGHDPYPERSAELMQQVMDQIDAAIMALRAKIGLKPWSEAELEEFKRQPGDE